MKPQDIYSDKKRYTRWQSIETLSILENRFGLNHNDAEKRLKLFLTPGFMPEYYFYSHSPADIAKHVIVITQVLDANRERVAVESDQGRKITYFYNVGTNIAGKLLNLLNENREIDIVGLDSIITRSGYRIVSIEKRHDISVDYSEEVKPYAREIEQRVLATGSPVAQQFLDGLPAYYVREEIFAQKASPRVLRHLQLYETAMSVDGVHVEAVERSRSADPSADFDETIRISFSKRNPERHFIQHMLAEIGRLNINLSRTYYDLFLPPDANSNDTVAIGSFYVNTTVDVNAIVAGLSALNKSGNDNAIVAEPDELERLITQLIQVISGPTSPQSAVPAIETLKRLARIDIDSDLSDMKSNFLLNVLTQFFEAAKLAGLYDNNEIMHWLLRFESISEFFVESRLDGKVTNKNAYRLRHSSIRGPAKGGLRIHPIAELSEVAALSFMMTWKTARSHLRLGGGKGGILLNPSEFNTALDFADSVSSFGKSLFLETGPFLDVPAGDVNCGPYEIDLIFKGYKAALRDLVTLAFGSKYGAAYIGKRVVAIGEARSILEKHFDVDSFDDAVISRLMTDEYYLELVLAAQITGKPDMGIEARNGATGLGLFYSILAGIGQRYLAGQWPTDGNLTDADTELIQTVAAVSWASADPENLNSSISDDDWDTLRDRVYPVLLNDKRIVLQGAGKVGTSVIRELQKFGVNLVAVADAHGAIIGDHIDIDAVLMHAKERGTVIDVEGGVTERIIGTAEGAVVLTKSCDILLPCALENAITYDNAADVDAALVVCGANGPVTPRAAAILKEKSIDVIYDFLANSGGVTASYFEWLRGITERFRYEQESIRNEAFDIDTISPYIMPEFRTRILNILTDKESEVATREWRLLIRDIMFSSFNDDFNRSRKLNMSLKESGLLDSVLRQTAACLIRQPVEVTRRVWESLEVETKENIRPYLTSLEIDDFDDHGVAPELLKQG